MASAMSTDTNLLGSTLIRARSPHPLELETPIVKHPTDNTNSIELAELGKQNDLPTSASSAERAKTPDSRLQKVHKHRARIQFAVMCFSLFMAGWNDGTTGPLLPRMQKVYHVQLAHSTMVYKSNWTLMRDFIRSASLWCRSYSSLPAWYVTSSSSQSCRQLRRTVGIRDRCYGERCPH